jgi:integrase/recombinase XerD
VRAGLDLPEQEAVHVFRHTYAMALVRNGVDIRTIQTLLGHAKITTTQVYLRMSGVEVAEAVQVLPVRGMLSAASPTR